MKKILTTLLALVLLFALFAGCATKPPLDPSPSPELTPLPPTSSEPALELNSFSLATLKGPTTMGLVKLLEGSGAGELPYTVGNTIYGTPDEISALIVGGKVDMAAVPCNLAAVLYNKTGGDLRVIAVNTLGVLNVLELGDGVRSVSDLRGKTIYSTGKGTTPEFALNAILRASGLDPETDVTIEYKSEATEIAALLAGDAAADGTIAVLPQPYATTVLMKNPRARIALDLTKEWTSAGLEGQLVTGVFVVRSAFAQANPKLIARFLEDYAASARWVNDNTAQAAELVAGLGIVADAAIAREALPRCAIVSISGKEMKTDIAAYLQVLFDAFPASVGGALPDDAFYYGAD